MRPVELQALFLGPSLVSWLRACGSYVGDDDYGVGATTGRGWRQRWCVWGGTGRWRRRGCVVRRRRRRGTAARPGEVEGREADLIGDHKAGGEQCVDDRGDAVVGEPAVEGLAEVGGRELSGPAGGPRREPSVVLVERGLTSPGVASRWRRTPLRPGQAVSTERRCDSHRRAGRAAADLPALSQPGPRSAQERPLGCSRLRGRCVAGASRAP